MCGCCEGSGVSCCGLTLCSEKVLKVGPSDISGDWGTAAPSLLNGWTPAPMAGL